MFPHLYGMAGGLFFLFFFFFFQVFFLIWPSCGWLFKFRQGRKLLVQSDFFFLSAWSLLHLLFFFLLYIFNFSSCKLFSFIHESSDYKVWIQQEKSSCTSGCSHDILTLCYTTNVTSILKVHILSSLLVYLGIYRKLKSLISQMNNLKFIVCGVW